MILLTLWFLNDTNLITCLSSFLKIQSKIIINIIKIIPKIKNNNVELFHFSNEGSCSWYEFAKEIFKINEIYTKLIPVLSNKYPTKAKRPNFSILSSDKIKNKYKFAIPSWMDALKYNFELVNE